jgi:hypothetical protein
MVNKSVYDKAKGSGGGGKENKKLDDEIERYHEIDKTLSLLSKKLQRIETEKDRAFGANKLVLFKDQIKVLEQELDATNTKLKEAESNLELDMANAMSWGIEIDPSTGLITNYDEIIAEKVEAFNSGELNEESYS